MAAGNRRDFFQLLFNFQSAAFDLNDQKRFAIRIAGAGKRIGRFDAGAIHKFDRYGQNPRLNNIRHAGSSHFIAVKAHQDR